MQIPTLAKNVFLSVVLGAALVVALPLADRGATAHAQSVTFAYFQTSLAPHGRWVVAGSYGEVWVPAGVPVGWQPYTAGRWEYTDYGWTWISFDPWGDIPYRYGTWTRIRHHGWVWIPGYVWAPAWVTWRYSDAHIGWAPVPPSLVITAIGYAGPPVVVERDYFVFVPATRFVRVDVRSARIPRERNVTIIRETRAVTHFRVEGNTVRNTALPIAHVERVSRARIERADINVVNTRPARIETTSTRRGERFAVAGPRERKTARLEEKSAPRAREAQPREPNRVSQRVESKRISPEKNVVPAPHGKGAAVEDKGNLRREGKGGPADLSPHQQSGRSEPQRFASRSTQTKRGHGGEGAPGRKGENENTIEPRKGLPSS